MEKKNDASDEEKQFNMLPDFEDLESQKSSALVSHNPNDNSQLEELSDIEGSVQRTAR